MQQPSLKQLQIIQQHFHAVRRDRASHLIDKYQVQLPSVEQLLASAEKEAWLSIPGMHGGFKYWLKSEQGEPTKLMSESWCRIVDGSYERHEIPVEGSQLVETDDATDYYILRDKDGRELTKEDLARRGAEREAKD